MSISTRIIILYFISIGLGLSSFAWFVAKDIKPRYREAVEESVVDTANLLASVIEQRSINGELPLDELSSMMTSALKRQPNANIYGRMKSSVDLRVYVTDAEGRVLYHSYDSEQVGRDYSKWNDILRTLSGEYGARATRDVESDANSSVLYSSAPIRFEGQLLGVLSVGKPVRLLNQFMAQARKRVILLGIVIGVLATLFSSAVLFWINRPLKQLLDYVRKVRDGDLVSIPPLGKHEIGELGDALEEMRETIEGREYVERYVQTLTHEIKSPLSVIQGASELLLEQNLNNAGSRFSKNILGETQRIELLVNRLLDLSEIEGKNELTNIESITLTSLASDELSKLSALAEKKGITLVQEYEETAKTFQGEKFLVSLALRNIMQNAIDFTPTSGVVRIKVLADSAFSQVEVLDSGPGVPVWAAERITERFFSLPRGESGRKSSGLGLSIVRSICQLHGGSAEFRNHEEGGFLALLKFPRTS